MSPGVMTHAARKYDYWTKTILELTFISPYKFNVLIRTETRFVFLIPINNLTLPPPPLPTQLGSGSINFAEYSNFSFISLRWYFQMWGCPFQCTWAPGTCSHHLDIICHNLDTQPCLQLGLSRLVLPFMSPTPLTPPILHLLNENKHLNQKMSKPDIPLFALSA